MNHKQLSITILCLCIVIGAIVFSEYAPAAIPFESGFLWKASTEGLTRITGKACSCGTESCTSGLASLSCTYNILCLGCEVDGSGTPLPLTLQDEQYGTHLICLRNGSKFDPWGCCDDYCSNANPQCFDDVCPTKNLRLTGNCSVGSESDCAEILCYTE